MFYFFSMTLVVLHIFLLRVWMRFGKKINNFKSSLQEALCSMTLQLTWNVVGFAGHTHLLHCFFFNIPSIQNNSSSIIIIITMIIIVVIIIIDNNKTGSDYLMNIIIRL